MKKRIITLLVPIIFAFLNSGYGQPSNYYMNPDFGPDGTFNIDDPISGIENRTFQATSTDNTFYIEWDSEYNEWYNSSINYDEEFTLTFEGQAGLNNTSQLNTNPTVGNYYTIQIDGLAYSDRDAVFMETDNAPQSFHATASTAVSTPSAVYPGKSATINVTLAGNKSAQEKVFVRYSDDGFSTSAITEATNTGDTWSTASATIPAGTNTAGTTVTYYAYSTTVAATNSSNHDLITLDIANNGESNYSYTVESSWTTSGSGDGTWDDPASWDAGEVPASGQPVTIEDNLALDQNATVSSLTINNGIAFTINSGQTLQTGGGITGDGTLTVNGSLQINSGGYTTIAPTYGSSSTLIYNSGTTYGRSTEWSATTGAGYPNNVTISNNTTLNLGSGGTNTARQCAGNLTINSGSGLSLNIDAMTAALTVKGNVVNNGTITLSGSGGGDLKLEGDFDDNGTFTANGRAVFFQGGSNQNINSTSDPLEIDVMRINKSGGEVIMDQNLLADETADPLQLNSAASVLNLNGFKLTIGKGGVGSSITMVDGSVIKGSTTSSLEILGTGAFGSVFFDQSTSATRSLNNFTVNRTSSGSVTLGNDLTIEGALTVTNGSLIIPSDADGTVSLITNGTVSGDVTVQRYLANEQEWHYISSPVDLSGTNFDAAFGENDPTEFFSWDEDFAEQGTTGWWIDIRGDDPTWTGNTFGAGEGYALSYYTAPKSNTYSLTGTPYNSNQSITMTRTAESTGEGWNLVGNPFPATMAANDDADATNNFISTNSSVLDAGYTGVYLYDESAGNYQTVTNGSGATYIDNSQAFMVKTATDGNTLSFNTADRKHGSATFYKSESQQQENKRLILKVTDSKENHDDTEIVFIEGMTNGLDPAYDGGKFQGNDYLGIYSMLVEPNSNRFDIQALPPLEKPVIVNIGIEAANIGEFTFSTEKLESFDPSTPITLEDRKTGEQVNLSETPEYTFNIAEPGTYNNRFFLHFKSAVGIDGDKPTEETLSIYAYQNSIYINAEEAKEGTVTVFNTMGQVVAEQSLDPAKINRFEIDEAGAYVIRVHTGSEVKTQKVIIQ
ncbi:MAG: T9SS type A sorting domain-containing protein [Bacteroidales bacterium]|nr:T9SS type A sorting domain-containing protein [Bacteroidales bacterium]